MDYRGEKSSINDFDSSLVTAYFGALPRQGPGSEAATLCALEYTGSLPADARIADLGCGTGASTRVLARYTDARITALDACPDFVAQLRQTAQKEGWGSRLQAIVGTMEAPPFDGLFDLIWSEGAIYNIGFERGIKAWKRYVKPGGYLAVTEISWLTEERPAEIEAYWQSAYDGMDTVAHKVGQLQTQGYRPVATFVLSRDCWTDNYYLPQRQVQRRLLETYPGNARVKAFIENQRLEAALYDRYNAYYGYVFYIAQRT